MDQCDNSYSHQVVEAVEHESQCFKDVQCVSFQVVRVLTCLLGLCGNALVIWISGFKMKKTVNTTWYLNLAISDVIYCVFLIFSITQVAMHEWIFGRFMCKVTYFVIALSMYSSVFLLVIIGVDRCVSVMFPVWSQNHRTVRKASIVVTVVWLLAIALSCPDVIFWVTENFGSTTICFRDVICQQYKKYALMYFLAGFIVPLIIIIICCSVIIFKHRNNKSKFSKSFKVMIALVAAFFLCLLPYHVFILLDLNDQLHYDSHYIGLNVGESIAIAHSFLKPVLYVFMGNDVKQTFKSYVLSKMENAMAEEDHSHSILQVQLQAKLQTQLRGRRQRVSTNPELSD